MTLPSFILLQKAVGQTPLQCMEAWRTESGVAANIPLTYAGRLDPMASGALLVLIGEECKNKDAYLALDKTYEFSVLFGIGSDTNDVLGRLHTTIPGTRSCLAPSPRVTLGEGVDLRLQLLEICENLVGDIELSYPHFSSKTVHGKPLHMWTLEGRLGEIEIPTRVSTIYSLTADRIESSTRQDLALAARAKVDTIPEVTADSKSLGNDFRRVDVRQDWKAIETGHSPNWPTSDVGKFPLPDEYIIAHFTCSASSGTYMRTLAKLIGEQLEPAVPSLAWSIHRTEVHLPDVS